MQKRDKNVSIQNVNTTEKNETNTVLPARDINQIKWRSKYNNREIQYRSILKQRIHSYLTTENVGMSHLLAGGGGKKSRKGIKKF